MTEGVSASVQAVWTDYVRAVGVDPTSPRDILYFGDTPSMQDALAALVVAGVKRATTSLARDYDTRLPEPGDLYVVVGAAGEARCIVRTTAVETAPLSSVTEAYAWEEGEGDRTRERWLADHQAYFERQAAAEGFTFTESMDAVFERFEIVWPRDLITNQRITVRLLLLDPDGRILLMKIDDGWKFDTALPLMEPSPRWITLGGGLEEGETVFDAAAREGFEESGIAGLKVGPAVWYGEQVGMLRGRPGLYKETFVVVHAPSCETCQDNWTEDERKVVKELRWWTPDELRATGEIVLPAILPGLLPDIIAGRYPDAMMTVPL